MDLSSIKSIHKYVRAQHPIYFPLPCHSPSITLLIFLPMETVQGYDKRHSSPVTGRNKRNTFALLGIVSLNVRENERGREKKKKRATSNSRACNNGNAGINEINGCASDKFGRRADQDSKLKGHVASGTQDDTEEPSARHANLIPRKDPRESSLLCPSTVAACCLYSTLPHSRFQLLSHLAYARPAHFLAFSFPRFLVRVCDPPSGVNPAASLRLVTPIASVSVLVCAYQVYRTSRRAHALYALLTFYHPHQENHLNHPLSPFSPLPSPSAFSFCLLLLVFSCNPRALLGHLLPM